MKKTYNKLSTDVLIIETEGSFMECSVRVDAEYEIESMHTYDGFDGSNKSEWKIGFED